MKRLLLLFYAVIASVASCQMIVGSASASFGLQPGSFVSTFLNADGSAAARAGSYPSLITTEFTFNTQPRQEAFPIPDGDVKDIEVALPPGLVGNATATPRCTIAQLDEQNPHKVFAVGRCPDTTQVGIAQVEISPTGENEPAPLTVGIYNLVAPPDVPAEFGLNPVGIAVVLVPRLRTNGDYGVTVVAKDSSQVERIYGIRTFFWGEPASHNHDGERGECLGELGEKFVGGRECPVETAIKPLLRLPTRCQAAGLGTAIFLDSWENPLSNSLRLEEGFTQGAAQVVQAEAVNHDAEGHPAGVSGCERVDFSPTVDLHLDTATAGAPAGLSGNISLPQNENPEGLGEADVRRTVVQLPSAVALSPSAAIGLQACTQGQIALRSDAPAQCPQASKLGTVEVETPLLEKPLEGSVYLAAQEQNPFGSLVALYVVAEGSGVVIKLAGEVHSDPATGQLTTTFAGNPPFSGNPLLEGTPQAPFSHLRLSLFGGPRGTLIAPRRCGTYNATGALTPWSSELSAGFSDPIMVNSSCGGGFAPGFVAGTLSNQAGGFSPLTLTLARSDQDQGFKRLTVRTPPGLLGMLSKVQVCEEPLIAQQACPAASRIGHVSVAAGAGPDPIYLPEPGHPEDPVYLTSGYDGAPFGLLTLVHAEAGPFNLGVVPVRATLNVDRRSSRVVATTDPIPTIVRGIPVDVKAINLLLDHEGFIFNPTDCEPLRFEGSVLGDEGATAAIADRFQAADCASLGFKPSFKAATKGKSSKANGASLEVKIGYPKGPQANIAAAKVQLPKQLPSRLTTIQKACPEATFAANPATCPAGSLVGTATATTPVLNVPVTGPASRMPSF